MRALLVIAAAIGVLALYHSSQPTGSGAGNRGGGFCSTHACIPNFTNGTGYIVQCADGEWSHSGGRPGACSGHGGEE
jgi:hypothetical protein